ncbi:WYL domain protein [Segatella baroniae F0067]|uniref:WYL domain protein n=1 Tax=Segatella baroniae F0067 TaxID=1115809 RepID=U2QMY4_9BACT|nr:WYL domain-containing protein [Segatella baroniae]ERK40152.1 WYL domain protein [Segatella baroniae F0067]
MMSKELQLILLMVDGFDYTAEDLCLRLGTTRRQIYNYLRKFREMGFVVVTENQTHRLSPDSPFFLALARSVNFTDVEATFLHRLLDGTDEKNPMVPTIRRKLERFYHLRQFTDTRFKAHNIETLHALMEAIRQQRVVCLKDYSSPHSNTVSNRVVEPYQLLNENLDIRCYELKTRMCKTFKLARIGSVEVYDTPWIYEEQHSRLFTDIFMFSGPERLPVRLLMKQLSHNLMLEEYPISSGCFTPTADGRWLFQADLASYVGIGRFILGLYDDIEILGDMGLQAYVRQKIQSFNHI